MIRKEKEKEKLDSTFGIIEMKHVILSNYFGQLHA